MARTRIEKCAQKESNFEGGEDDVTANDELELPMLFEYGTFVRFGAPVQLTNLYVHRVRCQEFLDEETNASESRTKKNCIKSR